MAEEIPHIPPEPITVIFGPLSPLSDQERQRAKSALKKTVNFSITPPYIEHYEGHLESVLNEVMAAEQGKALAPDTIKGGDISRGQPVTSGIRLRHTIGKFTFGRVEVDCYAQHNITIARRVLATAFKRALFPLDEERVGIIFSEAPKATTATE